MLGTPHTLILLLFLFLITTFSHSLVFNITNFDDPAAATAISYEGDGRTTNGSIDLNKVSYLFRVGRAIYSKPLHLWDRSSDLAIDFVTRFTFSIEKLNLTEVAYGDGFAFYLAPLGYRIPPNSGGGTFGLFNATTNSNLSPNPNK